MNADAAAAAEEDRRPVRRQPRPVGGHEQVGLEFVAQRPAHRAEIRRADLLAHLDDEFGVEAEPAAARLAHGAERRQIDAVLALVVGGAAAIDAIADLRGPPRIEAAAPLPFHAVDDVAMPVHQHGGRVRALAVLGHEKRRLAAGGFDHARGEIERGQRRRQFIVEIGPQLPLAPAALAFRPVSHPAAEIGEKIAGLKLRMSPGDGIGSGHGVLIGRKTWKDSS